MQLLCLALWFFVSKCNLCFDAIAIRKLSMDAFLTAADNALRTLSDVQTDTLLKKTLKSGGIIYTPCTIALNENVKMGNSSIYTNMVSISGNGRITRYTA